MTSEPAPDGRRASEDEAAASRRAEEAIWIEQRLNLALDSAQMGLWDLNLVNDAAVRTLRHDQIFGYSSLQAEWGYEVFLTHVVPEDRPAVKECFEKAFSTGDFSMECRIVRKDDHSVRWISAQGRVFRNDLHNPIRMMGTVTDITQRKRAEDEIERFFRFSMDLMAIASFDGYFKRLSPSWEMLFGWEMKELLSRPWLDFVHPEDQAATIAETEKLSQGAAVLKFENRYRCRDGTYRWLSWRVPAPEPGQATLYCVARDVTDRKKADELKFWLAAIVDSSNDAIIGKTLGGIITSWNHGAERAFGYTADEALGKSISMLVPAGFPNEEPQILERLKMGVRVEPFDTRRRRKDGQVIDVSVMISPVRDSRGAIIGASKMIRDITDRKRAEEALARAKDAAEAANRELEAFSYSVSHDLRAPLRHASGFVSLLEKHAGASLDEKGRRYLETIGKASQKMGRLIDDLLSFSRMGRVEMRRQPVSMEGLVRDVRQELAADTQGRDIQWKVGALPEVLGDPSLLRQVVMNLLSNALKYTRHRSQPRIEIGTAEADGGGSAFFVRDSGAGFDMQYKDKLFGVFQRLHRAEEFEGTGIGLAIVKRIIQRHGGEVWAEGKVGEGAAFYFTLPTCERKG